MLQNSLYIALRKATIYEKCYRQGSDILVKTLIIIPAYNVEHELASVLRGLPKEKLLVINDGSIDSTKSVIKDSGVDSIHLKTNAGVGNALKLGITYALTNGYTHAVTIDADGQHDPMLWAKFEDSLNASDFVIGSRFSNIDNVPDQKISSNFFASLLVYAVFGKKLLDISCGYRAFSLSRFHEIDNYSDSYGFLYDSLFNNIGSAKSIDIPCSYEYSELLSTRTSELQGFLSGIKSFTVNSKYNELVCGLTDAAKKK